MALAGTSRKAQLLKLEPYLSFGNTATVQTAIPKLPARACLKALTGGGRMFVKGFEKQFRSSPCPSSLYMICSTCHQASRCSPWRIISISARRLTGPLHACMAAALLLLSMHVYHHAACELARYACLLPATLKTGMPAGALA